jgi:MerR family mercuric resistance operon transcriptional regulator
MSKSTHTGPELTIGRLARAAGVNVETIRYYQRIGLIDEPGKPEHGYRKYSTATVEQIMFVKRAQQLGFSLQEIADLMALGDGHCHDVREHAEKKREKIDSQIQDLQALRKTLDQLINACRAGADKHKCPIVETLLKS